MGTSIIPPKHLNDRRSLASTSHRKYRAVSEVKRPFFSNKPSKQQTDEGGNNNFSSKLKQKTDFQSPYQPVQPATSRAPQNKASQNDFQAKNATSLENISVLVEPSRSKGQDLQFFEEQTSSIWRNLSSEAKEHFKNADEKRKRSIRENSSLQTWIISQKDSARLPNHNLSKKHSKLEELKEKCSLIEKEEEHLATQQAEIDSYGLSLNSKITKNSQNNHTDYSKNQDLIKKIIRKRIILPQVQIVHGFKHKKKLKKLYDNNQIPNIHKKLVSTVS